MNKKHIFRIFQLPKKPENPTQDIYVIQVDDHKHHFKLLKSSEFLAFTLIWRCDVENCRKEIGYWRTDFYKEILGYYGDIPVKRMFRRRGYTKI